MSVFRTFGVWKRRFPVVSLTMRVSLPVVQAIIATAVLHNICRNNNMEEVPPEVDLESEITNTSNDESTQNVEDQDIQTRADLINNYFI